MEKYILLGDLHFGKSKGNPEFLENQINFLENQLLPYMIENNIKNIFQLGDFLDNRKTIDGFVYNRLIKVFNNFKEHNIKITFPLGNHDIYFRESLEVHLSDLFAKIFPEVFTIIEKETFFKINNKKIGFIPWLVEGEELSQECQNQDCLIGHFEIKNFEVVKGIEAKHGLDSEIFDNIKVFSGHYHNQQRRGNILYVGTPYQFDWSDYKERKGFWVTDFNDYEEFIENTLSLKHIKIIFDDSNPDRFPIMIHGLRYDDIETTLETFLEGIQTLTKHKVKFIINNSINGEHMKCIQFMKELPNFDFSIVNNFQVSKVIKADYASSFEQEGEIKIDLNGLNEGEKVNHTLSIIQNACEENKITHILEEVIKIKSQL